VVTWSKYFLIDEILFFLLPFVVSSFIGGFTPSKTKINLPKFLIDKK